MADEVYFNKKELNMFKKGQKFSAQNRVDFFLPNSVENFSSNFLQKVRLTRQFQQTLASVRSEVVSQDSGNCSVSDYQNDDIDEFLFNDENEAENREILQNVFTEWRCLLDIR